MFLLLGLAPSPVLSLLGNSSRISFCSATRTTLSFSVFRYVPCNGLGAKLVKENTVIGWNTICGKYGKLNNEELQNYEYAKLPNTNESIPVLS